MPKPSVYVNAIVILILFVFCNFLFIQIVINQQEKNYHQRIHDYEEAPVEPITLEKEQQQQQTVKPPTPVVDSAPSGSATIIVPEKTVWVAHYSIPLADSKGSDVRLEQVLRVISQTAAPRTDDSSVQCPAEAADSLSPRKWVYVAMTKEGEKERHLLRLQTFCPAHVVREHEHAGTLARELRDLHAGKLPEQTSFGTASNLQELLCDELLVFFWPTLSYWNWVNDLTKSVRIAAPKCRVTLLIDELYWERWRKIQQDPTVNMENDFPWIASDWKLLRSQAYRNFELADALAFIAPSARDAFGMALPSMREKMYIFQYAVDPLPDVISSKEEEQQISMKGMLPLPQEERAVGINNKKGFLFVCFAQREFVASLGNFVSEVINKLPPDVIGPLHVVGNIKSTIEAGLKDGSLSRYRDVLMNNTNVVLHGFLPEEELDALEQQVVAVINPSNMAVGGVSTKTLRAMLKRAPVVFAKGTFQGFRHGGSIEQIAACDEEDYKCFQDLLIRLGTEPLFRDEFQRVAEDFLRRDFGPQLLAANILHWLGFSPSAIDAHEGISWPVRGSSKDTMMVKLQSSDVDMPLDPQLAVAVTPRSPVSPSPIGSGVYICGLAHNMAGVWPTFHTQLLRLVDMLVSQNRPVFVKLVAFHNTDATEDLLFGEFQDDLQKKMRMFDKFLQFDLELVQDEAKLFEKDRDAFLLDMRNKALDRLTSFEYGRVLFVGDVYTSAEDMMTLITRTAGGEEHYDMSCALNLDESKNPVSAFEARNLRGASLTSSAIFSESAYSQLSQQIQTDITDLRSGKSIQVFSCWSGIVAFDARVFLDAGIAFQSSSQRNKQGDLPATQLDSSSPQQIALDLWSKGFNRIYINPCALVSHKYSSWRKVKNSDRCQFSNAEKQKQVIDEPPKYIGECSSTTGKCQVVPLQLRRSVLLRGDFITGQSPSALYTTWLADINRNLFDGLKAISQEFKLDVSVMLEDDRITTSTVSTISAVPRHQWGFLDSVIYDQFRYPHVDLCISTSFPPSFDICHSNASRRVLWLSWDWGDALPVDWLETMKQLPEIWVPSRAMRQNLVNNGLDPTQILVVPFPVNGNLVAEKPYFSPPGALAGGDLHPLEDRSKHQFLFVGSLFHRKGLEVLLEAYSKAFNADSPVCMMLLTYGTSSSAESSAKNWQESQSSGKALPCFKQVHIHVSRDTVFHAMSKADTVVFPSRTDGFGLSLVEAMSVGTPVIATKEAIGVVNDISSDVVVEGKKVTLPITVESKITLCQQEPCVAQKRQLCGQVQGHENTCWTLSKPPSWHEPSVDDLARALRDAYEKRHWYREAAKTVREQVVKRFSPSAVARRIAKCVLQPNFINFVDECIK